MSIVLRGLTLLSLRRREEARKTQEEERARREINRRGVSWYYYGSMNERREFIKICLDEERTSYE